MTDWQSVWKRLNDGEHVVLCGTGPIPEPASGGVRLSWVDCEAHPEPGGTIEAARRRIDRDLDVNPWIDGAAQRMRSSLRRHLLGEDADDIETARDEHVFRRRMPGATRPRSALLLSGVDRADAASMERLTRLFAGDRRPTWPLLIRFDACEPTGAARRLLEQLERVLPPEAIFKAADPGRPASRGTSPAGALAQLSPESLRVLRAAATIGDRFEIETVAELLDLDDIAVLDAVQEAIDRGLSLQDRGHGIFRFEPETSAALRQATLPELSNAWHRRLAELFGGLPTPTARRFPQAAQLPGLAPPAVPPDAPQALDHERPPSGWQRLGAQAMARPAPAAVAGADGAGTPAPEAAPDEAGRDEGRSAQHAEAAGLPQSAAERYVSAAMAAARAGAHARALDAAGRALAITEGLPEAARVGLEARAWLVIGQCRWQARGAGQASLDGALEALERARALGATTADSELQAETAAMIANVCYDIGTPEALEQAVVEITRASQLWLAAKRPVEAAQLLNDEAAIWVKRGNPVRANELLLRSRDVFGRLVPTHPTAQRELLETEHLLARLILSSAAAPGREREALLLGVEHALAAEAGYAALEDQRQLGRVWETLGRLKLRLGCLDEAAERFERAQRLQRELGDAIGAARSAGGMSEVFAGAHDYPRALTSLAESFAFNEEKGSAAGLQHNLASLRQLEGQLPAALADQARALGQRLVRALGAS